MKKTGATFLTLTLALLLLFLIIPLALSTEGDTCTADGDCDTGEVCGSSDTCINDTTTTTTTPPPSVSSSTPGIAEDYDEKIEKGYECLEEKVDDDCSEADTVQELALTILATPDNVFDECVSNLKDKESNNHFGSVRDTALAIIALDHAGEDTSDAEEWLLKQNRTASDLTWYLQQDSNEAVECSIQYDGDDYSINFNENKKIDGSNTGTCLSRAKANFWLKIKPSCYDEEFAVSCSKDFIATLLYENTATRPTTYYILDETESAPGLTGTIKLKVRLPSPPRDRKFGSRNPTTPGKRKSNATLPRRCSSAGVIHDCPWAQPATDGGFSSCCPRPVVVLLKSGTPGTSSAPSWLSSVMTCSTGPLMCAP